MFTSAAASDGYLRRRHDQERKGVIPILKSQTANKKWYILLYCLALSFAFLTICSRSSFLYPLNNWDDSNCFFTMGKGMMNGQVLYRDLFEQKGPLLYAIHGFAYLISPDSFFGVYLFEIAAFTGTLVFCWKIYRLYLTEKAAVFLLPVTAFAFLISNSFYYGDSAEEFCLPLLTAGLYMLLKHFQKKRPQPMQWSLLFLNGVLAGCVLWIKYTMLGFWFGWMLFLFLDLLRQRRIARGFQSGLLFLAGMAAATVPWLLYFGVNGAIGDWIYAYFYVNIFGYSREMSFWSRALWVVVMLLVDVLKNAAFSLCCVVGVMMFGFSKQYLPERFSRVSISCCFLLLLAGVYAGGTAYPYYFFILAPFSLLGYIVVAKWMAKHWGSFFKKIHRCFTCALTLVLLAGGLLLSQNTKMLGVKREELVQYQFAEIIHQTPNATLLNYGFLDGGFYTAAGIVPRTRYFCRLNMSVEQFPEMMKEQNRYLKERLVDYVVLELAEDRDHSLTKLDYLQENYEQVAAAEETFENTGKTYVLYRAKDLAQ